MFLVILQHSGIPIETYLLAFHMPLFFLLSGYTVYELETQGKFLYNKSLSSYVGGSFCKLLIPYFVFEIVNLILSIVRDFMNGNNSVELFDALYCIVTCSNTESYQGICMRFWFLPCIFIANIFFWVILRIISKYNNQRQKLILIFLCVLLTIASYVVSTYMDKLLFEADVALLGLTFILLGYICGAAIKRHMNYFNKKIDILFAIAGVILLIIGVKFNNESVLMYDNQYGIYGLFWLGCIGGIVLFLVIDKYIYQVSNITIRKIVAWFGRNSLVIFPVHLLIIRILKPIMRSIVHHSPWYIVFLITAILVYPICETINKYFPWAAGKMRYTSK